MNNPRTTVPTKAMRFRLDGARRGKALVVVLVAGGTLLALAATAYIVGTWGK